jgi:uncharacterized protein (DUF488 family)
MVGFIDGDNKIAIYTVGHSTHPLDELLEILRRNDVRRVVDVRRFPRSRRMPHFNADALARTLPAEGIDYVQAPQLGGRRRARRDSPNGAWENESFRGYADHMETEEFRAGVERLLELADERPTAVMCAEALWHRCHRRLIADALTARGRRVVHIRSNGRTEPHALTPFAAVDGDRVTYPPEQARLDV